MCKQRIAELHCHFEESNLEMRDSTNKIKETLIMAREMDRVGLAVTDHETVSGHIKAIKTTRKLKEKGQLPSDFKLMLGNEIYLVDSLENVRDNYEGGGVTRFPHFLLIAKDAKGHQMMRELSSQAWEQSFVTGLMRRRPTTEQQLAEKLKGNEGHLFGTSACLGSQSSIYLMNGEYEKAKEYNLWCESVFGKGYFFLEIQPATSEEQILVNKALVQMHEETDIPLVITSDVHYLRPEHASIHSAFLNSEEGGDRETEKFYAHTYMHYIEEMYDKMSYLPETYISQAIENTVRIAEQCEDYTMEDTTEIPRIDVKSEEFELAHLFKKHYNSFPYIQKMAYSEEEQDRYLLYKVEQGFLEKRPANTLSQEKILQILTALNNEMRELWEMSQNMNQAMSAYYVTTAKLVELIWGDDVCSPEETFEKGSLVGVGRGSAGAWEINYLIGITQISPLDFEGISIPHWRHLSADMGDVSSLDIDLDINGSKKHYILERMRQYFGSDKVLQVCTFSTEGARSAIQTACRGLGYDKEDAHFISSLIPSERGKLRSIKECLYGNEEEGLKPITQFVNEINNFPKLAETALGIEGLINGHSVHAGGVVVFNEPYTVRNALMLSPNGVPTTQFNLDDTQACGAIKFDLLTTDSTEKIQTTLEYLIKDEKIKKLKTLKETYYHYLHPMNFDVQNPDFYRIASENTVPDLFQFQTAIMQQALKKAKPTNLIELMAINSIVRLMSDGEEQPIDTFVKHRFNLDLWYDEMKDWGLTGEEIEVIEEYLKKLNGVADTQEIAMQLAMDERIASFTMQEATQLRKGIAKKKAEVIESIHNLFIEKGLEMGTSEQMLKYIWEVQIGRQLGYSFSVVHVLAYTVIALQQIYLNVHWSPIYWQTAVLTVNSGSKTVDENGKQSTRDYGKTAKAIAGLREQGTRFATPLINTSTTDFTPDADNNRIIFALKGIRGMNDETVRKVIARRPYQNTEDFFEKVAPRTTKEIDEEAKEHFSKLGVKVKKTSDEYLEVVKDLKDGDNRLSKSQVITLIKAGALREFGEEPMTSMQKFVRRNTVFKEKLNGQNLSSVIRLGLFDNEKYHKYKLIYQLRADLRKHKSDVANNIHCTRVSELRNTIVTCFSPNVIQRQEGEFTHVHMDKFEKEYEAYDKEMKAIISSPEILQEYNIELLLEEWNSVAQGSVESWEMETIVFYSDKHELDYVDAELYNVTPLKEVPIEPVVESTYMYRGSQRENYKLFTIMGTVVDKNKDKANFTIVTPDGVVTCKTYKGAFSHYDKQVKKDGKIVDKSWFTRGNRVMVRGYMRDDMFILKAPKGMHTIAKIDYVNRETGKLSLSLEREY